jgi:hypothetical protein
MILLFVVSHRDAEELREIEQKNSASLRLRAKHNVNDYYFFPINILYFILEIIIIQKFKVDHR